MMDVMLGVNILVGLIVVGWEGSVYSSIVGIARSRLRTAVLVISSDRHCGRNATTRVTVSIKMVIALLLRRVYIRLSESFSWIGFVMFDQNVIWSLVMRKSLVNV